MKRKLFACTALVLCLALLCGCTSIATSQWMQDLFPVGDEAVAAQQTGSVESSGTEQAVKQVVTETYTELDAFGLVHGQGENAESVGTMVEKGKRSAFLASDITRTTGLEEILLPKLHKVDILKVGHHGYYGSTSWKFAKGLSPKIAIVTNRLGKIYPDVKWTLTMKSHSAIFATVDENGIIAEFTDNDEIKLSNHAQD